MVFARLQCHHFALMFRQRGHVLRVLSYMLSAIAMVSSAWRRCVALALACLLCADVTAQFARPAFEFEPSRLAADVVPRPLLRSPHYQVQDSVEVRDYTYVFRVNSEFGAFETQSLALLRIRLREIATLAQAVNAFQRTNSKLGARLRGTLNVRGNNFADILTSPFSTAGSLAGQLVSNASETLGASGAQRSARAGVSGRGRRAAGGDPILEAHRRTVASQLGLDVYSRNPRVQEFLDAVARAREGGRPGAAGIAMVRTPQAPSQPIAGGRIDAQIENVVRRLSAREVDEAVMEELLGMGLESGAVQRFIGNQALSPRHRLTIVAHLDFLGKLPGRSLLVAVAAGARSEAESLAIQELTRMYARYHESVAPLKAFREIGGWPTAASAAGWVMCVPVDLLHWHDKTERLGKALAEASSGTAPKPPVVMVAGEVTQAASRGLRHVGVDVRAGFMHHKVQ